MKNKIDKLTRAEEEWIATQLQRADDFVHAFCPADAQSTSTLGALDRAYSAWFASEHNQGELVNGTINCVGIRFGQFLIDELDLNWAIVTDQHGTDLAVHGLPGRGDVLVFPANFVAKRWERGETNFFEQSFNEIAHQVRTLEQNPISPARPWWKFW